MIFFVPTPPGSRPIVPTGPFGQIGAYVLVLARHRSAECVLTVLSFCNAAVLPAPVELVLVPMLVARPSRAPHLVALAIVASGVGTIYGYALGHFAAEAVPAMLVATGQGGRLDQALALLRGPGPELALSAAFAPLPFVLLTVAAGASGYGFVVFIPLALAGRALRLSLLGILTAFLVPRLLPFAARHAEAVGRSLVAALLIAWMSVAWIF